MLHHINTSPLTELQDLELVYPIGCDSAWLWPSILQSELSPNLYDWLTNPGSLTARLKLHCEAFTVQVLIEGEYPLSADEQAQLNLSDSQGFVREVLLKLDGIPWVFARSVMPLSTAHCDGDKFASLGNKPLGAVLFSSPDMQRSSIEVAKFDHKTPLQKVISRLNAGESSTLYGRRSCFLLSGKSLLVSEVFLPAALAYK